LTSIDPSTCRAPGKLGDMVSVQFG